MAHLVKKFMAEQLLIQSESELEIDEFLTNIRNQNWKPEKPSANTGQGF